jgi:hypothetical protein
MLRKNLLTGSPLPAHCGQKKLAKRKFKTRKMGKKRQNG